MGHSVLYMTITTKWQRHEGLDVRSMTEREERRHRSIQMFSSEFIDESHKTVCMFCSSDPLMASGGRDYSETGTIQPETFIITRGQ